MSMISTSSEAPTIRPASPTGRHPGAAVLLGALAAAALAMSPAGEGAKRFAGTLHPHMPDASLWQAQPTVVQIHVLAALSALGLGTLLMVLRKGARFHRVAGWTWVSLMAVVAGSSLFITGFNGNSWSWIHLLSGWTLLMLPVAVLFARRRNIRRHRRAMMSLFYLGPVLAGALTFIPGRLMWNLLLG
jgi:uncharacterized membrane protein